MIVYIAFVFGSFAGNLLIYYGARTIPESVTPPIWLGLVRLLIVPITVAVAEETLYRGYLLPRLQVHLGRVGAVIVSALLAAAQNLAFGMGNLETVMAGFVGSFIVGLAFGALYLWFKRLTPLILVHWLFEAIVGWQILNAALH